MKLTKCSQCGEIKNIAPKCSICLDCSKKNLKETFKKHPDVEKVFIDTIHEMKEELETN